MQPTPAMHNAVEREAKCKARFETAQTVIETIMGDDFSRFVEVFRLEGHATAARAFIWKTSDDASFRIILSEPRIVTAEDAVRSRAKAIERNMTEPD